MGEHVHHVSANPYLDMVKNLKEMVSSLTPEHLEQLKSDVPDFDHYVWLLDLINKETS